VRRRGKRKLVDRVTGADRPPDGDVLIGFEAGPAEAQGITVDLDPWPVRFLLDGQPPLATTKGWGRVPGF
jgi:hypothetical protein